MQLIFPCLGVIFFYFPFKTLIMTIDIPNKKNSHYEKMKGCINYLLTHPRS